MSHWILNNPNLKIAKPTIAKNVDRYKVHYEQCRFFIKRGGKEYNIILEPQMLNEVLYLYSLPHNDKHEAWNIIKHGTIESNLEITANYWAIIKPDMVIKGKLFESTIYPDLEYINKLSSITYNKIHGNNRKSK